MPEEEFKKMERDSLNATSNEVLGNIRLPLQNDTRRLQFLAAFLLNNFVANADRNCLKLLWVLNIVTADDVTVIMQHIANKLRTTSS
jgi:hypothetical protein